MKYVIEIRLGWWARAYLSSVLCFARLTRMEPDLDKVAAMVMRGIKTKVRHMP